ncbi:MAG: hypothetical protein ACI8RA_000813 [Chlamydiales bacterium]|jgi:hypothetical protein
MSGPIENMPVNTNIENTGNTSNEIPPVSNSEERVSELAQMAVKPSENPILNPASTKREKERCYVSTCKKRITIVSRHECNGCNEVLGKVVAYCSKHRLASDHDCSFDYRKAHQEKLRKENPLVVASKNPGWDF